MKKLYTLSVFIIILSNIGFAQTDNEFWFAVPEVSWRHNDAQSSLDGWINNAGFNFISGTCSTDAYDEWGPCTYTRQRISDGQIQNRTWRFYELAEQTYLHISALDANATVTIDMPKYPGFTPIVVSILANQTQRIDLTPYIRTDYEFGVKIGEPNDRNIIESGLEQNGTSPDIYADESGLILNKGIHISSTSLITAYLERNNRNNPDLWALKGQNAFGTEFIVPSQNAFYNQNLTSTPDAWNAIDIVAVEDVTLYVTSPVAIKNLGILTNYPFTLSKGQSLSLKANARAAVDHLGGTYIITNGGKIAVQWKDDSVHSDKSGCYDLMGDQLVPVDLAGNEYIVMRGELANGNDNSEYAFIMAIEPGTTVSFEDGTATPPADYTFSTRGEIHRVLLNSGELGTGTDIDGLYIKSTGGQPFIVFHVTGFGCEMGAAIVPTIKGCTGSTTVSFMRSTDEGFFLNLMCKEDHIDDFYITINGANYTIPDTWFTEIQNSGVDATTNWWYLDKFYNEFTNDHTVGIHGSYIPAVPVDKVSKVFNTTGLFHLGLINGGGSSGCRYGYFSDFSDNFGSAVIASSESDYLKFCYQDTIQLQASGGITYAWEYTQTPYNDTTFVDAKDISTTRVKPPPGFHTYEVNITRPCYLGTDPDTVIPVAAYGYPEITAVFDTAQIGPDCCSPYEMKYFNTSIGANKFEWTFERVEDTLNSIVLNPEVIYFSNKTYSQKDVRTRLKVSYSGNCPDTASKSIPIKPEITASASKGSKSGCQQDVTVPYTIDTVGAGPITNIYWNWGDGDETETLVSDLVPPFDYVHTFTNLTNNDTSYYVTLVFIDSIHNCIDTLTPPYYDTVFVPGVARARYSLSTRNGCSPLDVTISNNSNGDVTYKWWINDTHDFTGPADRTDNFASDVITFQNDLLAIPKDYYIFLEITKSNLDGTFCYDTFGPDTITVYPEFTTTISPSVLQEGCNPLSVDFSQNTEPNVPNLQFEWDFGNGSTSGDSDPAIKEFKHTLVTDQNYQVTLETTSEYNCKSTAAPVDVLVYAFVDARFTVSDTVGCSPLTIEINNNTHINSVTNFVWDIDSGTGTPVDNAPFNVEFENKTAANITQTITLNNNNPPHNCPVSFAKEITIYPEINASFIKNRYDTLCNNESVTFTNKSFYTNIADLITGATATYYWEFGDGTTSSVENPVKVFKNTETSLKKFYVKLTLTLNGCESSYFDSVSVYSVVKAQVNTPDVNVCAPNTVTLSNTSLGGTSYLWEFSDGTPDVNRADKSDVVYAVDNLNANSVIQPKVYLTASSANCTHTDSLTLNVFPHIVPHIEPDVVIGCGPLAVTLANETTGGNTTNPLSYTWDFGDGETSNVVNPPKHTFSNRGGVDKPYTINLTATNAAGCFNSHDTLITVFPEVEALFSFNKNTECSPMPVFIDNNSLNGNRFQWDFGFDGNTIDTLSGGDFYYQFYHTNANPNARDVYTISLKVIDENHPQCSDSVSYPINVYPPVIADFNITDNDEGCSPLESEFTNSSTGYKLTYVWDYRDSNTSGNSQTTHTHIFENLAAANKLYDVKLTASDTNGCAATTYQTVTAFPKVVADFTYEKDLNDRCTPYPVYFAYPETALNGNKFSWDFGFDGEAELFEAKTPFDFEFNNELPNTIENYTIQLIATDTLTGCTDTTNRTIEVYPRLVPAYQSLSGDYEGCNPLTLNFENESTGLADYLWDFNDEQTSPDESPQHIFAHRENSNRDFEVLLTATQTATGCVRDVSRTITVYSYLNPKFGLKQAVSSGAKADALLGGCSPFEVQVTDSSTCNGTWYWDFGSDAIENIEDNQQPPSRELTYTNEDEDQNMDNQKYSIVLIVENPEGCTKETSQSLEVYPRSIPNFSVDLEGCHPLVVNFENTTVDDGNSQYYWKLGDGATAVEAELEHTYYNSSYFDDKDYNVWLYCTTSNLCSDSIKQQITVYPKPLAAISPELDRGCSPLTASLINASKGTKPTFNWDFDNGETKETTAVTTEHPQYVNNTNTVEIKYVELIVESEQGCSDTVTQLVNVYPEASANFGYYDPSDTSGCSPHEVEFLNLSNATSTVYHWDFGNETTSQLRNPTYRFINDGDNDRVFTVTLNVESPYGCKSTYQDDITVYLSPNAEFLALDPIKQYPDTVLDFVSLVKPGPWTYDWDYGDGHYSNTAEEFHKHVYDGWGPREEDFSYTVWLKAYSEHCVDSVWQFVTINPPEPYINIVQRNPLGCVPLGVDFNVTYAFGYEDSIRWNFGNGVTSRERDPYYVYEESGVYISLVTISGDGGTFIDTTKIYVYPLPEPSFEFRPDFVMLPDQPVQFFNTTYLVDKSNYYWDFGDGTSSTEVKPWHQYTREGVYDIKLVATTFNGCKDSVMSRAPVTVSGEGYIQFPNAFLPTSSSPSNGSYPEPDTENDVFHPINKGVKDYELWIFNRWGEQIFYSDDILVGWNGRYGNNGDELGQDVYFWKTKGKFNNDVPFKEAGDVTLIRR